MKIGEAVRFVQAWSGDTRWPCVLVLWLGFSIVSAEEHQHRHGDVHQPKQLAASSAGATDGSVSRVKFEMPPLPVGVTELKFSDFFVRPVGKRGLELTDKLQQLDGKRVRILGYMVDQVEPPPGRLLLTPMPKQIHEHDNGLADDLPASTVYVSVPTVREKPVPHAPGLMLLTGTLSVGNRTEADGRISVVRLALDPPEAGGKE